MSSKKCANKTVMILGIIELFFSLAVIGCGVFEIVFRSYLFFVGHGIWGGLLLAVTSVFAITAGRFEKTGLHITHMVLAIVSCIFIIPSMNYLFGEETSVIAYRNEKGDVIEYTNKCVYCSIYSDDGYSDTHGSKSDCNEWCNKLKANVTNELIAMCMCGLLFIIMIISASFTCCVFCSCCGANVTNGAVYPSPNETIVVCRHPMEQQSHLSVQMQTSHPNIADSNSVFEQNQMQMAPPPPAYGQATFSAALAGQTAVEHQQSVPEIAKIPDASALYV